LQEDPSPRPRRLKSIRERKAEVRLDKAVRRCIGFCCSDNEKVNVKHEINQIKYYTYA